MQILVVEAFLFPIILNSYVSSIWIDDKIYDNLYYCLSQYKIMKTIGRYKFYIFITSLFQ